MCAPVGLILFDLKVGGAHYVLLVLVQVESLVSAREQEKEERANLLREKEELQHLVDALRSQLASLREQVR